MFIQQILLNRVMRSAVLLREQYAISYSKAINADSILDIGCGQCNVLAGAMNASSASKGFGLDFWSKNVE